MTDKLSQERRSWNMSRIQSHSTKPEMIVRRLVHSMGFRFRLHRKDLPGKPDLVLPRHKKIIFVHGCFWHQHHDPNCTISRTPKSNKEYWTPKLQRNIARDAMHNAALKDMGWQILIVWECQTRKKSRKQLEKTLRSFLQKN